MKSILLLLPIAFGCFALLGLTGCDKAETPPPEPKVVRKKIAPPPESLAQAPAAGEASEAAASSSEPPSGDSEAPADALAQAGTASGSRDEEETGPEAEESTALPAGEAAEPASETETPATAVADASEPAEEAAETDVSAGDEDAEPADGDELLAETSGDEEAADAEPSELTGLPADSGTESGGALVAYAPGDRVDPFEPLFRDEPERRQEEAAEEEEDAPELPKRRLTPLERLDLSQLKLVGIIRAPSGDRALVEEASGKGYIITRGTYIGIHSGQVVEIQEDGVIVEEKHEDMYGDMNIRRRELKFQRPSGDEIL
jgi:type IV pilus assembly protein PilP